MSKRATDPIPVLVVVGITGATAMLPHASAPVLALGLGVVLSLVGWIWIGHDAAGKAGAFVASLVLVGVTIAAAATGVGPGFPVALALLALGLTSGYAAHRSRQPLVGPGIACLVLVLLAALFLPMTIGTRRGAANVAVARSFLRNIAQALAEYESDHGAYPPSDPQMSGRPLLVYLDGDPANGGPAKMYYEFRDDAVHEAERPIDPWGHPYRYLENRARLRALGVTAPPTKRYFPTGNPDPVTTGGWNFQAYDVWSLGHDPTTTDYLGNW